MKKLRGGKLMMLLKKDDEVDEDLKSSIQERKDELTRSDFEMKERNK